MSSTPGGDSRRRAEIEAKRAKLAELKRAREERSSRLQAGRTPTSSTQSNTPATGPGGSRKDIDDLVATLVGSTSLDTRSPKTSTGTSGIPDDVQQFASPRRSAAAQSEFDGSDAVGPSTLHTTRGSTAPQTTDASSSVGFQDVPDMVDVSTELFEFPQRERVYYTKEVQTATTGEEFLKSDSTASTAPEGVAVGTESHADISPATEAAIRKKILEEQADSIEKDRQLKREEEELERQIEEELRIMSPEEISVVFGTQDFSDFVENSSKIVERALTDAYDYMKDYSIAGADVSDEASRDEVKLARCFWDDKLCKGRSVTAIDWSPKHPELVAIAYSRSDDIADASPDGLVLVWNMHLSDRPEFVFQAQTDVLSVCFSPFHPNIIVGGTYSGQILLWDTRSKGRGIVSGGILPTLKTPLSALTGHTHPVYSLSIVGTQNANHLITASTDGLVCSWMLPDMLARPVDSLQLLNSAHPKTDEVSVTTLGFMQQGRVETNAFWVGTEEGSLWTAARHDRAGAKAGLQSGGGAPGGHAAPVTSIDFHRAGGSATAQQQGASGIDFSDLLLTSSMDWTAKLWRVPDSNASATAVNKSSSAPRSSASANNSTASTLPQLIPLLTFDDYSDYVLCAQWHPTHPSLFATCDASGILHVHDLLRDVERSVAQVKVGADGAGGISTGAAAVGLHAVSTSLNVGLNKLAWDRSAEPRRLACGGTDGRVYVLDVGGLAATTGTGDEWTEMGRLIGRTTAAAAARTAGSGPGR